MSNDYLLDAHNITKEFTSRGGLGRADSVVRAVNDVTLGVRRGEILGLVGESGCGKSTLARCLLRLLDIDGGTIGFDGSDITHIRGRRLKAHRRQAQLIFQDPYASINPRMSIRRALHEPLSTHGWSRSDREDRIRELLELVAMPESALRKHPHQFSGGQCQRIAIARALALHPTLLVADEPVSALDVSIQAQILNLLKDLQESEQLTMLFIAHDLSVVRYISDRIAVMYLGRIVELANADDLFADPIHPYTRLLLKSVPVADPDSRLRMTEEIGDLPSPMHLPPGCAFHPRCPIRVDSCPHDIPPLREHRPNHWAACHAID